MSRESAPRSANLLSAATCGAGLNECQSKGQYYYGAVHDAPKRISTNWSLCPYLVEVLAELLGNDAAHVSEDGLLVLGDETRLSAVRAVHSQRSVSEDKAGISGQDRGMAEHLRRRRKPYGSCGRRVRPCGGRAWRWRASGSPACTKHNVVSPGSDASE